MKKRVRKLRGGGMDASRPDFGDTGAVTSDAGFENTSPSKVSNVNIPGDSGANKPNVNQSGSGDVPFKAPLPNVGVVSALINYGAYQNYKGRQKFARKEGLYRDQYKTTGKVLQPNSPAGKKLLREAGYGKTNITPERDGGGAPIKAATPIRAQIPKVAPYKPYYMGFDFQKPIDETKQRRLPSVQGFKQGGLSGGKKFGAPPKKGPNSHGTCPHRKDGIRGVGVVEKGRGVKFVGVK